MIDKVKSCFRQIKPLIYESSLSMYELVLKLLEKVNEVVEFSNGWQEQIDALYDYINQKIEELDQRKEDSINITNNRKLSEIGDFTGTLCNNHITACELVAQVDTNTDEIRELIVQFEDGATGQVIECGFFGDDNIDRNYDGGVF